MGIDHAHNDESVPNQVGTCVWLQHVRVMLIIITPPRVLLGLPVALVQLAAQPPPPLCCLLHINNSTLLKRRGRDACQGHLLLASRHNRVGLAAAVTYRAEQM